MSKYTNLLSEQIKEDIESYIIENQLKPYDALPSERKLAEHLNVNRLTLRAALKRLRNEHHIFTKHGKGNFISPPKIEDDTHNFTSFTTGWSSDGYTTSSKVVLFELIDAPLPVSTHLNISLGEKVYLLKRIRLLDSEPILLETSYIPQKYCPNLEQYNFETSSLYDTLKKIYHLDLKEIQESIEITSLTKEESIYLNGPEEDTAFFIKSTAFDSEKPVEYCISIGRAERYMMSSKLKSENI